MPKENDLEGPQDQGGKHGGQAGMPRRSPAGADQGVVRDEGGQEQPRIKNERSKSAAKTRGTIHRAKAEDKSERAPTEAALLLALECRDLPVQLP